MNLAKPMLGGSGKKKRKAKKIVIKKKTKRTKVKLKLKGSPVGVHNAIQKLAGNAAGFGSSSMKVEIKDGDKENG